MSQIFGKFNETDAISIINQAIDKLKPEGKAYSQPVLNQMGVSINERVPNLIFIPDLPNKEEKHVFVIEFKPCDERILPNIFVANANQYKYWLQEANNTNRVKIEYGLASNGDIIADSERESSITPIASVTSVDELVEKIHDWVKEVGLNK